MTPFPLKPLPAPERRRFVSRLLDAIPEAVAQVPAAWRWFALLVVLLAALMIFSGCETAGPATRNLEAEEVASILAYRQGAEEAVAALRDAYRGASLRELSALAELDARDDATVTIEYDAEGKPVERRVLDEGKALALVEGYAAGRDKIEAEIRKFAAAWEQNRANIEDAMVLRAELRRWLERSGIQPEQIDGLVNGIAGELEKRR